MLLIGFAGPAGSGKDTGADYLAEKYSLERASFAQPLKAMLTTIGIVEPPSREAKEAEMPEWGFSYRQAAQKLGTEWGS